MAFVKGTSGNANGGRIKSAEQREFEAKCRQWCKEFAFGMLSKRALSDDEKVSGWALEALLNRAFGKPVETSVIDANVTTETGHTVEALADDLAAIVGAAEDKGSGNDSANPVDGGA